MHIRRFTYKREDVDCKLCTEYRGGIKCPHSVCPYITERIEAGAVTYQDAVYAMILPGCQLIRRLPKLILTYQDSFWVDDRHKSRMEFFNTCMGYIPSRNTPAYYAAMYLLTANETLYWRMANCFCHSGLDFSFVILKGITDLDKSKIEEQKKAVRAGYDMDIIPSDLATYGAEAKKLLSDLQSRNQRMFLVTFLILNTADTKRQLDNNVFQTNSIAQKYNCSITALDYQQEEGMVSSLPLGLNQIEIQRGLTSSGVAIFVPFTTQELYQDSPEALYYGLNALSNNIIMVDRKLLKNPNGLILGTPGSGKSFSAKREISNVFLATDDDIMICDPEGEYFPLVQRLEGQVIKISPTSKHHINPMDINLNYSDEENPLSLKSDFILSLCELIVGGKDGLKPVEKTIIDRCVRMVYQDYLNDPKIP